MDPTVPINLDYTVYLDDSEYDLDLGWIYNPKSSSFEFLYGYTLQHGDGKEASSIVITRTWYHNGSKSAILEILRYFCAFEMEPKILIAKDISVKN